MLFDVSVYTLLELAAIIIVLSATWLVLKCLKPSDMKSYVASTLICVLIVSQFLSNTTDTRQLQKEFSTAIPALTASNRHLALMLYYLCVRVFWSAVWSIGACILTFVYLRITDQRVMSRLESFTGR